MELVIGTVLGVVGTLVVQRINAMTKGKEAARAVLEELHAVHFEPQRASFGGFLDDSFHAYRKEINGGLPKDLRERVTRYYQRMIHLERVAKSGRSFGEMDEGQAAVAEMEQVRNRLVEGLKGYIGD